MKIRNAVVDGIRVFSVADIARTLGTVAQSFSCTADKSLIVYFSALGGEGNMAGLPYSEVRRVIKKRLKRSGRIGNEIAPSIIEWMSQQPDLERLPKTVEAVRSLEEMTSEEIYESGRMAEFLEFVAKEKEKSAERNNAIREINLAKLELQRLQDETVNSLTNSLNP